MKKLHLLVIKSFIGPLVLTFFFVIFVLLMQFLWKYIDDLIGKGLEWGVISEFLLYTSASLVPLAMPLAVLTFNFHWNEFFRPLVFLNTLENFPITLGIFVLQGYFMTGSISVVLAGVVLSLIPVVAIFIVGQRYLIEGIMMGAVKG